MFTAQTQPAQVQAGALSTDDVNIYQGVGALAVVSTVGACTLGVAIAAPVPVIGTIGCGAALMYYGSRLSQQDEAAESDTNTETNSTEIKKTDKKIVGTAPSVAAA